jgi:putative PIN family toxin of toxin-antitoxin system
MKAVFDTNIFISAFVIPGSQGERAFLLARGKRFQLYTSVAILTETANTLRDKFDQSEDDIKLALRMISRVAKVVQPVVRIKILSDIPDNRILECAAEAAADIVITGDRHLLKLKKFQGIPIVRLVDFLRMFPEEG